jgi:hypothetical protein
MTARREYDPYGPEYYERPEGVSNAEWESFWLLANRMALYCGPLRRGDPWTVEKLDRAIAWQERRRAKVPYVHRVECSRCGHCWKVDAMAVGTMPYVVFHYATHREALATANRAARMGPYEYRHPVSRLHQLLESADLKLVVGRWTGPRS